MALGLPYDSDEGRAYAAAITSLMTGHSYEVSARTPPHGPVRRLRREPRARAARARPCTGRRRPGSTRSSSRRSAVGGPGGVGQRLRHRRDRHGVRNSQASVLAPTARSA
jgi:ribonucleoside-diphosphate reductase alpha chain